MFYYRKVSKSFFTFKNENIYKWKNSTDEKLKASFILTNSCTRIWTVCGRRVRCCDRFCLKVAEKYTNLKHLKKKKWILWLTNNKNLWLIYRYLTLVSKILNTSLSQEFKTFGEKMNLIVDLYALSRRRVVPLHPKQSLKRPIWNCQCIWSNRMISTQNESLRISAIIVSFCLKRIAIISKGFVRLTKLNKFSRFTKMNLNYYKDT